MEEMDVNADPWNVVSSGNSIDNSSNIASNKNIEQAEVEAKQSGTITVTDLGLISMIFGILAIVFWSFGFAVAALVVGIVSYKKKSNTYATAGILCSIASFFIQIATLVYLINTFVPAISDTFSRIFS